jgi:hypothetical protein
MPTLLRLGHANGNVTTFGFGYEPGHDDLQVLRDADHDSLNDHSKRQRTWMLSLPEEHQPYFTHVSEVDLTWPTHSEHPPVWVSCPEHPELEQAVAAHFTGRGHTCLAGRPEG